MRYADINRKFTEKVAEYIASGWTFNTGTMNGNQCVDLTNGKQIARIEIRTKCDKGTYDDYLQITVAVNKDEHVVPNSSNTWAHLWDSQLEVVEESERFYKASNRNNNDWFVSKEQAYANDNKHYGRLLRKRTDPRKDISEKAAPIVLNFVRRQYRCKTAKVSDINVIRDKRRGFIVIYKDHSWTLK